MIFHLDCREGRYIKAQDPSKEPYMMKKKGPYKVINMQTCMDWCNKFETCSYFSFQKIEKLCFLFEVRYSRPHGKTKGETSGPRWCTKMKMMETPVQNNKSKI